MAPAVYAQSTAPAPTPGTGGTTMPGAGPTPPGAAPVQEEKVEAISGWSVKDKIIGNAVYNEGDEKIGNIRSEEHTSELQSLMRISYAVFCLKKKQKKSTQTYT